MSDFPVANRRAFLAGAAGATIAASTGNTAPPPEADNYWRSLGAVVKSFGRADPVMTLARKRRALQAEVQPLEDEYSRIKPGDPREDEAWGAQKDIWNRIEAVETEMMALVATSPAGIAEQVDILRDFISVSEYEPLIDTVIAGLRDIAAKRGAA